jgi:hypothetical protein
MNLPYSYQILVAIICLKKKDIEPYYAISEFMLRKMTIIFFFKLYFFIAHINFLF